MAQPNPRIRLRRVPVMLWCYGKWPLVLPGGYYSSFPENDNGAALAYQYIRYWFEKALAERKGYEQQER